MFAGTGILFTLYYKLVDRYLDFKKKEKVSLRIFIQKRSVKNFYGQHSKLAYYI